MPPRRKTQRPTSTSASQPGPSQRRSKLAKENSISNKQESQIREAFSLFSSGDGAGAYLATADLRRALIALDAAPESSAELGELMTAVDPDDSGRVSYEHFVAIAALGLGRKDGGRRGEGGGGARTRTRAKQGGDVDDENEDEDGGDEEVRKAYTLFTRGDLGREITLEDLRRVARQLKEDVPEGVLKDMLREATGGVVRGLGMEEFEGVMRRAGVFS